MTTAPVVRGPRSAGDLLHRVLRSPALLLGVLAPFVAYEVLTAAGMAALPALAAGTVFPLAGIAVEAVRHRRLDIVSAGSLAAIAVGLLGALIFDSARFLLVKDSIITGVAGLVFLASLATSRPLVATVTRRIRGTDVDALWADPAYRRHVRLLTAVWGAAMVGEAVVRFSLSFLIPAGPLMLVSPVIAIGVFGAVAVWTFRRRAARLAHTPAHTDVAVATRPEDLR